MFVYDFVILDQPFGTVAGVLAGPDRPGFAGLKIGASRSLDGTVVVPIRWDPGVGCAPFEHLHATLQVAPYHASGSHLSVSGNYDEPVAGLGRREDANRRRQEAEMSVRTFLQQLAGAIARRSRDHPVDVWS